MTDLQFTREEINVRLRRENVTVKKVAHTYIHS